MKAKISLISLTVLLAIFIIMPGIAAAHCDTLAGPVVLTAKAALEKGDVTPLLKWVKKEHEKEITDAFNRTLKVRKQSAEARELADMYFFETLVRIHRAGEGAPYTGLKPGEAIEPIVMEADKAIESGSADKLLKEVTDAVAKGIREKFTHVMKPGKHADESVEAGREFVEAYVIFTHYVERLYNDATAIVEHHGEIGKSKPEAHQH